MKIDNSIREKSGIYKIVNDINSKCYIGSSINLYNRLHVYLSLNKRGRVHNKHLQSAFNKYGISNFSILILEFLDITYLTKELIREKLKELEQKWVDNLRPEYNKRKKVDLNCQVSPDISTRKKISNSMKESIKSGRHEIKRVQSHSIPVSLFDLEGNLIQRFSSCGLLAEYIGRKGQCLLRHAYCYGTAGHKCGNYLIYLTVEEDKILPYKDLKKKKYDRRNKRIATKRSNGSIS